MDVLKTFFAVCLTSVISETANATQFYVSTTGSDSAAGTSASPWRTLQHAADAVGAGDNVNVLPGSYAGFDLRHSGTAAAPISFSAQPGVVINAASQVRQRNGVFLDGINLEDASYVVVDGFSISGMPEAGVRSVGDEDNPAKFVTVRHVTASNNGEWGIFPGTWMICLSNPTSPRAPWISTGSMSQTAVIDRSFATIFRSIITTMAFT
ncbi:MAG TPA: hypothetical protein VHU84_01675 [Lacipirellulaceae bacterium]|nr:hypothetical protein [Lacipirellulaceae bacterium]